MPLAAPLLDPRPPASDADLAELAAALGQPVPPEYAGFLREHNGGYASVEVDTPDGAGTGYLDFLGVGGEPFEDVLYLVRHPLHSGGGGTLDHSVVPIATDGSGNHFCLSLDDGAVLFWDKDTALAERAFDSFDEFLSALRPVDPD